jgi:hypothetical protein
LVIHCKGNNDLAARSNEAFCSRTLFGETHTNLYEYPYEVQVDPLDLWDDTIIDCFYKRIKSGEIRVDVQPWRLYPQLANQVKQKANRGWWTLPCSKINRREEQGKLLLDPELVAWLTALVKERFKTNAGEWEGALKHLISALPPASPDKS